MKLHSVVLAATIPLGVVGVGLLVKYGWALMLLTGK